MLRVAGPLGAQGRQKAAGSREQMSPPHPAQCAHLPSTRTLPSRAHPRPRAHRWLPSHTCSDIFTDIASSVAATHSAPPTPSLSPGPRAGSPAWSQTHRRARVHTNTHPRVSHGCLAEDTVRTPSGALSLRAGPWSVMGIGVRFCTGLGVLSLPYPLGEGRGGGRNWLLWSSHHLRTCHKMPLPVPMCELGALVHKVWLCGCLQCGRGRCPGQCGSFSTGFFLFFIHDTLMPLEPQE